MFRVSVQPLLLIVAAVLPLKGCAPPRVEAAPAPPPPPMAEPVLPEIDPKLLKSPPTPKCAVKAPDAASDGTPGPEQLADPELLEIARLEVERDCYKAAEIASRKKLKKLQATVSDLQ